MGVTLVTSYYAPWSDDGGSEQDDQEEVDDDDSSEEEDQDQNQEVDDDDDEDLNPEKRLQVPSKVDVWFDEHSREENDDYVIVIRYLVESSCVGIRSCSW